MYLALTWRKRLNHPREPLGIQNALVNLFYPHIMSSRHRTEVDFLTLYADQALDAKAHGPAATVRQGFETAFLLAGNYFMARDPGNSKLATQIGNALSTRYRATSLSFSSI